MLSGVTWRQLRGICWVLVLGGCVGSVHPLSDAETSEVDERLLGQWQVIDRQTGDVQRIVVEPMEGQPKVLSVGQIDPPTGSDEPRRMEVFCTRLGNERFLSLREFRSPAAEEQAPKGIRAYIIVKYEMVEEGLQIWPLNRDFLIGAVTEGKLLGSVTERRVEGGSDQGGCRGVACVPQRTW